MAVLITGGTGYIGSHTAVELMDHGMDVVIVDNFSNSKPDVLEKIAQITGKKPTFYEVDLMDREKLCQVFEENKIDAVIHFAGYKAVGESVKKPLMYYHNNLTGAITLCEVMDQYDCRRLVFSSSATVYGVHNPIPYVEDMPITVATNPYGNTKVMLETVFKDLYRSDPRWSIALLRYFNPIGAHESGLLGENPNGIPTICCHTSFRWQWASWRCSQCMGMTTTPSMVPVCVTISMSWIWRKVTVQRLII